MSRRDHLLGFPPVLLLVDGPPPASPGRTPSRFKLTGYARLQDEADRRRIDIKFTEQLSATAPAQYYSGGRGGGKTVQQIAARNAALGAPPDATHRSCNPEYSHCFYKAVRERVFEWREWNNTRIWYSLSPHYYIDDVTRFTPL